MRCPDYDLCATCFNKKTSLHAGDCSSHDFKGIIFPDWSAPWMAMCKGKGKGKCKGKGKGWWNSCCEMQLQEKELEKTRPCAREGCNFAATWHPTHCCAGCATIGAHGGRCERKPIKPAVEDAVTVEEKKLAFDLSFPVEVGDGRQLTISWNHGDDAQLVSLRFAEQHGILPDELPTIAGFVCQAMSLHGEGDAAAETEKHAAENKAAKENADQAAKDRAAQAEADTKVAKEKADQAAKEKVEKQAAKEKAAAEKKAAKEKAMAEKKAAKEKAAAEKKAAAKEKAEKQAAKEKAAAEKKAAMEKAMAEKKAAKEKVAAEKEAAKEKEEEAWDATVLCDGISAGMRAEELLNEGISTQEAKLRIQREFPGAFATARAAKDGGAEEEMDDITKAAAYLANAGLGHVDVLVELLRRHDGSVGRALEDLFSEH